LIMNDYIAKMRLDGKVAVVTGGLGLIGREICMALAQAGAKVIAVDIARVNGRAFEKGLRTAGLDVNYENIDLAKLERLDAAMDALRSKYGYVDVFVNNAYPRTKDWAARPEALKLASWRKNIDMQLNSYAWLSRKACLLMRKRGGSVINIGSIYGVQGPDARVYKNTGLSLPMAYSAIKGGVINLTRYLAAYFGPYGIRVNTVCPGGVFDGQNMKFVRNYAEKTPLKRMANSEDVAGCVLFAASGLAAYVTGDTLMVDGGWSIV